MDRKSESSGQQTCLIVPPLAFTLRMEWNRYDDFGGKRFAFKACPKGASKRPSQRNTVVVFEVMNGQAQRIVQNQRRTTEIKSCLARPAPPAEPFD